MQDGSAWISGINLDDRSDEFIQAIPSGVTAVAAGNGYSIALKQDGSVWSTGSNWRGQLGDGSRAAKKMFTLVLMFSSRAKAVTTGGHHSMVLTHDGRVWATGWNKYGQLGFGSNIGITKFRQVFSGKVEAVAAGNHHSIVLKQDASVWAVGRNYNGQLGDGSMTETSRFVKVMSSGAANVAAGGYHSMVIKQDGSVWATGCNEDGQLGDGSTTDRSYYIQVVSSGAKIVSASSQHSMMLKQDGSVWATGYNHYGQLGDGSTTNSQIFVQVISQVISDGAQVVAAGAFHSMVVMQDGSVWAAGSNKDGQFGIASTPSTSTFVKVAAINNGGNHKMLSTHTFQHSHTMPYSCNLPQLDNHMHLFDCRSCQRLRYR